MSTFTDLSKNIVCDFLHNVVLADDRIEFHTEALPSAIVSPTRENIIESKTESEVKISERAINVKPIIDEFMAKGIPCSFLLLDNSLQPEIYIKNLKKSDALILDWQVKSDDGEFILQILEKLFENDRNSLKVILIYTGLPDLKSIIQKIRERFPIIPFSVDTTHGCSIRHGSTLISVYSKTNLTIDNNLTDRVVDEKRLVEALLNEFTSMTSGLVSNAALKTISILRQNTHNLLNTLNKNLDSAILTHRALLKDTAESEEHLVSIISSEIIGLLQYNDIGSIVSMDQIKLWVDEQSENGVKFYKKMKIRTKSDGVSEILKILEKGIPNISPSKNKNITWNNFLTILKHERNKNKISELTSVFLDDSLNALKMDEEFAQLMAFQSNYQYQNPKLDQGTILKSEIGTFINYYVCIQPKCDCVRIKKSGEFFIFLPLKEEIKGGRFDFLIKEDGLVKRLVIQQKSNVVEKFKFYSRKTGSPVFATKQDTNWNFIGDKIEGNNQIPINFKFLGYLKQEFIQRVVNNFANNITRIGFSESEWLRRWAK